MILPRSLSVLAFPHYLTNEDKTTIQPTQKAITAFDLAGIHRDNTDGSGRSRYAVSLNLSTYMKAAPVVSLVAAFSIPIIMLHGRIDQSDNNENNTEDFVITHGITSFQSTASTAAPSGRVNDTFRLSTRGRPPTARHSPTESHYIARKGSRRPNGFQIPSIFTYAASG